MRSRTTERFRKALRELPEDVQDQARAAYDLFRDNPRHPGLRFKPIHPSQPIYSVRIGRGYRAVGLLEDDTIVWYWIGSHAEYDHLIAKR